MKKALLQHISLFLSLICLLAASGKASALDLSTYADNSRLATGNWVKISVPSSGVYLITNERLRQLGFRDASSVRVYGYGAKRLPDRLDSSYIDDLPQVQSIVTSRGIIFYGLGPLSWDGDTPVTNPFAATGCYYLGDIEGETPEITASGIPADETGITTFTHHLLHEEELTSIGETGHCLVGEEFRYNSSQSFTFNMTDRIEGTPVTIKCSFMAKSTQNSSITLSANGNTLPATSSDNINSTDGNYLEALTTKEADISGDKLSVGVRYNSAGTVSAANLNYIAVAYTRPLTLGSLPQLLFTTTSNSAYTIGGVTESTVIWDVTDPGEITRIDVSPRDGKISWMSSGGRTRNYAVFNPDAALPSPTVVGRVYNQNLHAVEVPDMIIFTPAEWMAQAQRLADFHQNSADALKVLVVDQEQVFNEFSSGARDANSFRKMLKMIYDRSATSDRKLQYAIFFGRGVYDNRRITTAVKNIGYPTMPIWQTERGVSNSDSYSTDDIFAFLRDNSGTNMAADYYCIAVGRMPVTSVSDARSAVDKIMEYSSSMPKNGWRNRVLLIADDKDSGIHMKQTETMHENMMNSAGGTDMIYKKLFTDAYVLEGNTYPAAREVMFRSLEEGVSWLTYIGHASTTSWSHEGLLTYTDMNAMHLRTYPVIYAATCEFLRWDAKELSGAEIMWKLNNGGCIAVISANRPVYISNNGNLSASIGRWAFNRDDQGRRMTIGQIYMNAKNDFRNEKGWTADSNKLRYVLMGDPAMRPIVPSDRVIVESINGIDPESDEQPVIMGGQQATMTGRIVDGNGNPVDDFNGILSTTLYDAEYSVTTHGYKSPDKDDGLVVTFQQTGDRLYAGNDSVKNGRFDITIPMPMEIANNFREAAVSFYAYSSDASKESATGVNRQFYVFGYDDNAEPDTEAPTIKSFYLNHPTFKNGDAVNTSPMVIAEISDDRGINMSAAGIGHQMTLLLDEKTNYNDVNQFYTPSIDGTASGTIAYTLDNLTEGNHTLRLRVWDTTGNSSVANLDFFVKEGVTPKIYDVYTDANPASVEANFYLSHDRPDAMLDVTFSVYNMLGQPVWSSTSSGRSDMYLSYPVKWNLTDNAGRRVPRGIYLYRASINADGQQSETVTHRIAVTAP